MTATSAIGRRAGVGGFTLIELLVALSIMVLLASAVPIALGRLLPARRVSVAADRLVADLQWLQGEAIRQQTATEWQLLPEGYRLDVGSNHKNVSVAETTSIQVRARADQRELQLLMFFPDGTAQPASLSVSDTGRKVRLEVGMLTGRVTRSR